MADGPVALAEAVRQGERPALGRAITLLESTRADHRAGAMQLLEALLPHTGGAFRIAVTGTPGAGKSTLIDALGMTLVNAGRRVAVLAIDPSSEVTGGSILGDKTRMGQLARRPEAFVRPSPSRLAYGGVAAWTHEAILVCEAAGYDVVLVETVGVGQGETRARDLVDCCLLLWLGGAGDALQGIKKGVLEAADLVAVHKADGDGLAAAEVARTDLMSAFRLVRPDRCDDAVLLSSSHEASRVSALWERLAAWQAERVADGSLSRRRAVQREAWMWHAVETKLLGRLAAWRADPHAAEAIREAVRHESILPERAADAIVDEFGLGA